jgi:hypothetical protein
MQKFKVVLEVTVNTAATVSESELLANLLDMVENFDGGTAEVKEVTEQ